MVTSWAGHVYTGICDGHVQLGNKDRESQWVPRQVAKWSPGRSGARKWLFVEAWEEATRLQRRIWSGRTPLGGDDVGARRHYRQDGWQWYLLHSAAKLERAGAF